MMNRITKYNHLLGTESFEILQLAYCKAHKQISHTYSIIPQIAGLLVQHKFVYVKVKEI